MSRLFTKTSWTLAVVVLLVQLAPVAVDVMVCIDERPDRDCCDRPPAQDAQVAASNQPLEGADCSCCIRVQTVSETTDATEQKFDGISPAGSGSARGHDAPITRVIASVGRDAPDNARLPSLGTVVLLI